MADIAQRNKEKEQQIEEEARKRKNEAVKEKDNAAEEQDREWRAARKARSSAEAKERLPRPPWLPLCEGKPAYSVSISAIPNAKRLWKGRGGLIVAAAQREFRNVMFRTSTSNPDREKKRTAPTHVITELYLYAEPAKEDSYDKVTNDMDEAIRLELELAHRILKSWQHLNKGRLRNSVVYLDNYAKEYKAKSDEDQRKEDAAVAVAEKEEEEKEKLKTVE